MATGAGAAGFLARASPRPRVRAFARVLLALLPALLLPLAAHPGLAQSSVRTLSDLEEPLVGEDLVVDFVVTSGEAGQPGIVVFLNPPGKPFGLVVYRQDGTEAYVKNGTRGIQPFPALDAGPHKLHLRGGGAVQITRGYLDRLGANPQVREANGTIRGTDAYVLAPTRGWVLHVEGDVRAELRDLGGTTRTLPAPVAEGVTRGGAYVLSLRAPDGTPYRVWLEPTGPEPATLETGGGDGADHEAGHADAPGPGPLLLALALAGAALVLRRRR